MFDKKELKLRLFIAICFVGMPVSNVAQAHHRSSAVFSADDIEIEGLVTEFNFKNPHLNIILTVTDEKGVETEWMATGPGPTPFRRWGWTPDTVRPGQFLRIFGRKSRDGGPMILMEEADIHGGKIVEISPTDRVVLRTVSSTSDISRPSREMTTSTTIPTLNLRHNDGRPNLNGMWLGSRDGLGRDNPPFNVQAAAAQNTFDPFEDDPAFTECADAGLVRQATTIRPLRITQHDDRLVFEYEEFAARRVIYLDERDPETSENTLFGYHIARYEGDTLVIESNQLLANLTGPRGNALSDQATTVEIYRRLDNSAVGPAIEMRMIVTDPGNLTRSWELGSIKYYTADVYDFVEVDCRLPYLSSG